MIERRRFLTGALGAAAAASVLGSFEGSASAQASVPEVLEKIRKARATLKTLIGPFEQTRSVGLLATKVKSKGELTLVTPDRLRWELFPPDAATYWITPAGLAFATPKGGVKAGKGAAGRFGAVLSDLMIMIGGDLKKLEARYSFSVPDQTGGVTLVATPKVDELKKMVKKLELEAGAQLWDIERIVIEEKNGDRSTIVFSNVKRNLPVDPKKMQPPP